MKESFFCQTPYSKNQIVKEKNNIDIYGGDKSKTKMIKKGNYKFKATEAYIMEGSHPKTDAWNVDIGMAIISDKLRPEYRFFNRELLKTNEELESAKCVPICLPAKKYQVWTSHY